MLTRRDDQRSGGAAAAARRKADGRIDTSRPARPDRPMRSSTAATTRADDGPSAVHCAEPVGPPTPDGVRVVKVQVAGQTRHPSAEGQPTTSARKECVAGRRVRPPPPPPSPLPPSPRSRRASTPSGSVTCRRGSQPSAPRGAPPHRSVRCRRSRSGRRGPQQCRPGRRPRRPADSVHSFRRRRAKAGRPPPVASASPVTCTAVDDPSLQRRVSSIVAVPSFRGVGDISPY